MNTLKRLRVFAASSAAALLVACLSATVLAQEAGLSSAVEMRNVAFAPAELHVAPGTTITWTNYDAFQHSVTADDASFDSGLIDAGGSYSLTFNTPGTYQYYCTPHGSPGLTGMAGVVVVDGTVGVTNPALAEDAAQPPADVPVEAPAVESPAIEYGY